MNYSDVNQGTNVNHNQTPIDVSYEELNKIYTIDEVSNILGIEQSSILFYYEKLNDFLKIASVGAFQLFNEIDIDNLSRVKHLDKDLNMSMNEIRKYLKINEQEILIERKVENKVNIDSVGQLLNGLFNTINNQNQQINSIVQLMSATNNNIQQMATKQDAMQEQMESMSKELNSINKELAVTKELSDVSDKYRALLKERNLALQEPKNIFKRLLDKMNKNQ